MPVTDNKAIARRYFEGIWNERNLAALDELVAGDFAGHAPDATIQGAEALKKRVSQGLSLYPDIHFTVEDVIGEGDKVCVRWKYTATTTGKKVVLTGLHLFRIAGGRIAEFWLNTDELAA